MGKIRVAAALLRECAASGRRAIGMKPVASGVEWRNGQAYWQDVEALQAASTVDAPLALRNPYRFEPAIAPHIAAKLSGITIDILRIQAAYVQLTHLADIVVVEGAGGVYAL